MATISADPIHNHDRQIRELTVTAEPAAGERPATGEPTASMSDARHRSHLQSIVDRSALDAIYLSLLNRPADKAAVTAWTGTASIAHVLDQVMSSSEFRDNLCHLLSSARRRDSVICASDTERFYDVLRRGARPEAYFEALMRELTAGGTYFEYHRKRFSELHCYIDNLNARRRVQHARKNRNRPSSPP